MVIAISRDKVHRRTLPSEADLPEGDRTIFLIRTLRRRERARIMGAFSKYADLADLKEGDRLPEGFDLEALGEEIAANVALGLEGWEKLRDEDNREVEFTRVPQGGISVDSLEWADELSQLVEVLGLIMEANRLGAAEKKA